jgi:hypothetical protein
MASYVMNYGALSEGDFNFTIRARSNDVQNKRVNQTPRNGRLSI